MTGERWSVVYRSDFGFIASTDPLRYHAALVLIVSFPSRGTAQRAARALQHSCADASTLIDAKLADPFSIEGYHEAARYSRHAKRMIEKYKALDRKVAQ